MQVQGTPQDSTSKKGMKHCNKHTVYTHKAHQASFYLQVTVCTLFHPQVSFLSSAMAQLTLIFSKLLQLLARPILKLATLKKKNSPFGIKITTNVAKFKFATKWTLKSPLQNNRLSATVKYKITDYQRRFFPSLIFKNQSLIFSARLKSIA